jgi:hypothetical protein
MAKSSMVRRRRAGSKGAKDKRQLPFARVIIRCRAPRAPHACVRHNVAGIKLVTIRVGCPYIAERRHQQLDGRAVAHQCNAQRAGRYIGHPRAPEFRNASDDIFCLFLAAMLGLSLVNH